MSAPTSSQPRSKHEIAAAIAGDIPAGSFVNLGIGQPTLVADHLTAGSGVVLHTENGMLGMGPAATGGPDDPVDPDAIRRAVAGDTPAGSASSAKNRASASSTASATGASPVVPRNRKTVSRLPSARAS